MNSFNILLQIILIVIFNIYSQSLKTFRKDYTDLGYESLLEWSVNNSLIINNKIKLTIFEDEKQYISNSDISKGEIILDIPPQITLTVNKSLSLFKHDFLASKYQNYIDEDKKSNQTLDDLSHIDQSFISYLLYKANKTKENVFKNFYDYYNPLFYIFGDDLSHLPSFFTDKQINLFINTTYFGTVFELMNLYLMGEVSIFEKKIFKETINLEEYFRYRFILIQKSYNISNVTTVAPFIDFIKRDFNEINCKLIVKKGHIIIKTKKEIKAGEILTLKPRKMSNQYSFIFNGKTYEELIDYMPSFIIPVISSNILYDEGIYLEMNESEGENKVDLAWTNFFEIVLPTYKKVAQSLKKDDSDYACYDMILKYLEQIKGYYELIKFDDFEDYFLDKRDSNNVKRIIKGEKMFLERRINDLLNIMDRTKKVKILHNKKYVNNFDEQEL